VQDLSTYSAPPWCAVHLLIVKFAPQADTGSNRLWV